MATNYREQMANQGLQNMMAGYQAYDTQQKNERALAMEGHKMGLQLMQAGVPVTPEEMRAMAEMSKRGDVEGLSALTGQKIQEHGKTTRAQAANAKINELIDKGATFTPEERLAFNAAARENKIEDLQTIYSNKLTEAYTKPYEEAPVAREFLAKGRQEEKIAGIKATVEADRLAQILGGRIQQTTIEGEGKERLQNIKGGQELQQLETTWDKKSNLEKEKTILETERQLQLMREKYKLESGMKEKLQRMKGSGKGTSGGSGNKLDKIARETAIRASSKDIAELSKIRDMLKSGVGQLKNPKLSDEDKITLGKEMLKVINSPLGRDAVGVEEAKRLGSRLEWTLYDPSKGLGNFSPDIAGFTKQMENAAARVDQTLNNANARVNDIIAGKPLVPGQQGSGGKLTPKQELELRRSLRN